MLSIRVADYRHEIEEAFGNAKSADIAVAFATDQGLRFGHVERELTNVLEAGGSLRVIVDLALANTHPNFLERLLDLQARRLKVECRSYASAAEGVFHPKLYIFLLNNDLVRVISGSANWTGQAYSTNIEHGLVFEGEPTETLISAAQAFFEGVWNSPNAKPIDSVGVQLYRAYWRRRQGLERKTRRRSSSQWNRLQEHLAATRLAPGFQWPSSDAAFLLGALAARGFIHRNIQMLSIEFRYGGGAYKHKGQQGYIGKGDVSYKADEVVPLVPEAVANRIKDVVAPAGVQVLRTGKWTYRIEIDASTHQSLLSELRSFFGTATSYQAFHIPRQILSADRELQDEFVRGYGLACALVSQGTSLPKSKNHQVWLRPATENTSQFNELVDLLEKSMGIPTYKHRRAKRDVEVKIRCESWLEIGFGVDWLDAIVEEGARLNNALAPTQVT